MASRKRYSRKARKQDDLLLVAFVALLAISVTSPFKSPKGYIIWFVILLIIGTVIYGFIKVRENRIAAERRKALRIQHIDAMGGIEFEHYVGALLLSQGYKVSYTPNNDYGIDVVAKRRGDVYGVQAKRYKANVGIAAVQQAVAGGAKYKCNKAMVVTNSYYTIAAKTLAAAHQCELINRDQLADWILKFSTAK